MKTKQDKAVRGGGGKSPVKIGKSAYELARATGATMRPYVGIQAFIESAIEAYAQAQREINPKVEREVQARITDAVAKEKGSRAANETGHPTLQYPDLSSTADAPARVAESGAGRYCIRKNRKNGKTAN